MHLRIRAFRNILEQDGSYFDDLQHTPGKLITRLATDAPNVKAAMDTRLSRVCQGILSLCTAIIFSMFIDLSLTLVCSLLFILQGVLQFFLARKVHRNYVKRAQTDEAGRVSSFFYLFICLNIKPHFLVIEKRLDSIYYKFFSMQLKL